MKETKIGGVEFTDSIGANTDPYIIGVFGEESVGKTRFALTGPEVVGCVPLEMKAYLTLDKDSQEFSKRIFKPKDPMSLIVGKRKVDAMKDDAERQKFYMEHVAKVKETTYQLLEHKEVRLVMIDKFTTYCVHTEYAINGFTPRFVKIGNMVRQSKAEVRQSIIDFVNSLSQFKKPVVLNCATKADYDVVDAKGEPMRNTWDCGAFYMLGSHANLVVELVTNPHWDLKRAGHSAEAESKYGWKYGLNVRRCQRRPELEGPEGNPLLRDDQITLPNLIQAVEPDVNIDMWV